MSANEFFEVPADELETIVVDNPEMTTTVTLKSFLQGRFVAVKHQPLLVVGAGLVQRFIERLHNMEPLQNVIRLRKHSANHVQLRLPHVTVNVLHSQADWLAKTL